MKRFFCIAAVLALVFSAIACVTRKPAEPLPLSIYPAKPVTIRAVHPLGLIFDPEQYAAAKEIPDGTRGSAGRGGEALPQSFSLKEYAPVPGNQGNFNSCFAWASAYTARTIIESQYLKRTNKFLTTKMAIAPFYLYSTVREIYNIQDPDAGATFFQTVTAMENYGLPRQASADEELLTDIFVREPQRYFTNPIIGWGKLFNADASLEYKTYKVKNALLEGDPVIFGIKVPESFYYAKDLWAPDDNEEVVADIGHALCVVGYDDKKYGGAFEVMNSFGEEWGNGGFVWMSYETFSKWMLEAWAIAVDTSVYSRALEYTGAASVELMGKGGAARVRLLEDGSYRLLSAVKPGAQIRIVPGGNAPSGEMRTYIFYTDAENKRALSAGLNEWIKTDTAAKPENIVILYTRSDLDINSLLSAFGKESGNIQSRLEKIFGQDFIRFENSYYANNSVEISADFMNEKAVAGMVLSIHYDAAEKPIEDMIRIEGGKFVMGSPVSEQGRNESETQREVTLSDFYIGAAEVTAGEFRDFVNETGYTTSAEKSGKSLFFSSDGEFEERAGLNWKNPVFTQEDNHPVVHVSFYDIIEYCNWRSRRGGLKPVYSRSGNSVRINAAADGYRLPAEAEWEYACRAGSTTPYNTGDSILPNQANFSGASMGKTTPVRKYPPNQWGLYDTHGNVLEWCGDVSEDKSYSARSGTWFASREMIRAAFTWHVKAEVSANFLGFRLARNAE